MFVKARPGFSALLMLLIAVSLSGQNRFGTGFSVGSLICLTDLTPRLSGSHETRPVFEDVFNFSSGVNADYQLENGLAFTIGGEFSRKRFGFIHEGVFEQNEVKLWGHSEYYTFAVPFQVSYVVYSNTDPYFDIAPYVGVLNGANITSYRNLTRLDENYFDYFVEWFDYDRVSFSTGLQLGINVRTFVDQLGMMYWGISFITDLTGLAPFDYRLFSTASSTEFNQQIRMNMVSVSISYYFRTWEVFDGRMMRRSFD